MNRATLALLLAMLAWGTSVTVADAALANLSAADLLLLETLSGTAAVVLACRLTGRRSVGPGARPSPSARSSPVWPTSSPTSASL